MQYPPSCLYLVGPGVVTDWLDVNGRRGASPCVLKRHLKAIETANQKLARAEKQLAAVKALPEDRRAQFALMHLNRWVEVRQQWLDHAIGTMANALRYAIARITPDSPDGQLLRTARPGRYGSYHADQFKLVRHYASQFDAVCSVMAVRAGNSRAKDALAKLYDATKAARDAYKNRSGGEPEDAEQDAIDGVITAAKRYDVSHPRMAQFATFSAPWVRRSMQKRTSSQVRPGYTVCTIDGERRIVPRLSIEVNADENDVSADCHHPVDVDSDPGVSMDVNREMAKLSEEDRELLTRRFVREETIAAVATAMNMSASTVNNRINKLKQLLSIRLGSYSCKR